MMSDPSRFNTHRLSTRDRQIIDHVVRHRVTTNEVVHKLFFHDQQHNAVTKVTGRLCRCQALNKFPLYHPRSYFTLGQLATQDLGLSIHRSYPLGPQSLPTEYGTLAYATLGSVFHRRLTTSELRECCPWLTPELLDGPHCLDETADNAVVELIRVDLGGKPHHVARKCQAGIAARLVIVPFERSVREGRFRPVIVTGTTEKAAAIRDALQPRAWPDGLQIHLAVVPELLSLTARFHNGP